ncbi:MAG: type VI toxin-antitoxin system SocB family DNA replication inhibitor toxin [Asticcacaulis sp.]|uniref:type VI toxin-antitoxin system SocB family DNA replication inhibitor toxin n=1 Tax=Asticcacaulis sp. TaxID=1872648 RepID=UPI003F7C7DCA
MRPLHPTDLARLATFSPAQREAAMRRMTNSYAPYSYDALRKSIPAITNVQFPLFKTERLSWENVKAGILKECRTQPAKIPNLATGKGLYNFCIDNSVQSIARDFGQFRLKFGQSVVYWEDIIVQIKGRPYVICVDPRLSNGLNSQSKSFVFSMMHEHIRANNPDYVSIQFAVCQFERNIDGVRKVIISQEDGYELYTLDRLEDLTGETLEAWRKISTEREEEVRRGTKRTGTGGLL